MDENETPRRGVSTLLVLQLFSCQVWTYLIASPTAFRKALMLSAMLA
jgi:hypothetical protein